MKTIAITCFFPLLLLFVIRPATAQDYIVTNLGDSLTGEVKPLLYGSEKRVQFTDADGEKSTFTIFEVREFSYEGDVFHPVKGDNGYVFMKLLQPGYLSLYAYQPENQTRFDGRFLRKLDGESMVVPNLGFKKYLSRFMEDCPEVAARIEAGEFSKRNLDELIDSYNTCVIERTASQQQAMAGKEAQYNKISPWIALEDDVRERNFSEKATALEMIAEVKKKILRQEHIPNFLLEGLRNSLKGTGLSQALEEAVLSSKF